MVARRLRWWNLAKLTRTSLQFLVVFVSTWLLLLADFSFAQLQSGGQPFIANNEVSNVAEASYATISGGVENTVLATLGYVGAGWRNKVANTG